MASGRVATSPRPEVEGDDDDEEEEAEVKATAGRTSSTAAIDESVAKSSVVGSKDGCTAVARSTTGRRETFLSTRGATGDFNRMRDDNGVAARWGERLPKFAAVVRIVEGDF